MFKEVLKFLQSLGPRDRPGEVVDIAPSLRPFLDALDALFRDRIGFERGGGGGTIPFGFLRFELSKDHLPPMGLPSSINQPVLLRIHL